MWIWSLKRFSRTWPSKRSLRQAGSDLQTGAILASNTSYLNIDDIAAVTKRPQDVVGMHFFSPANVMRLLENVRGAKTVDDVKATVMKVGKKIGKVPVMVGVCDGFVGNRMLAKRTRNAVFLLEEGALPTQIDKVIYNFGFPMGPYAMSDMAGLDVGGATGRRNSASSPSGSKRTPSWIKFARWAVTDRRQAPVSISTTISATPPPIP
jgi:3-hydroxyacyl-CoA dehydrogenase